MAGTRRVVITIFPEVDLLDATGPAEVFALANRECGRTAYRVELAGRQAGPVATSAGVRLLTDIAFAEVEGSIDTLVVPGAVDLGPAGPVARVDADVVAWVAAVAPAARRVASVCVGAHVPAAAGCSTGRPRRRTGPPPRSWRRSTRPSGWTPTRYSCGPGKCGPARGSARVWTSRSPSSRRTWARTWR